MAIKSNETDVRENARNALSQKSKDNPTKTANNSVNKTRPTLLRQFEGGDQTENHSYPIRPLEFEKHFLHRRN